MKRLLLYLALLCPAVALAATATPAAAPSSNPNFCDQSFTAVTETADNDQVAYAAGTLYAVPCWTCKTTTPSK